MSWGEPSISFPCIEAEWEEILSMYQLYYTYWHIRGGLSYLVVGAEECGVKLIVVKVVRDVSL